MKNPTVLLRKQISYLMWFFMISLTLSGITAIPVRPGIQFLLDIVPSSWNEVYSFLLYIKQALFSSSEVLFYGYDWLAFAHIIIAILFYGVARDPARNIWVIEFGMIACVLVIPFALLMGYFRGIPLWWRFVDCSFGLFGIIPLWFAHRKTIDLVKIIEKEKLNTIF